MPERLPLIVVTGFLGSGKTTLVNRYLSSPGAAGTGLIVNEFGEIGVDHHLFVHAVDHVELVAKGRARRADVSRALHDLVRQSKSGQSPIERVILETSGLADPGPVIAVLAEDPWLRAHVTLQSVIAVIDAVAGPANLLLFDEARRQVAVADRVVVTKTDLRKALSVDEVERRLAPIATGVTVCDANGPAFVAADLFAAAETFIQPRANIGADPAPMTDGGITSFVMRFAEPVEWPAFTVWLSALLHAHGNRILRVKGLLRTSGSAGALVVHGVQHIMHPPTHLAPDRAAGVPSYLVFIVRGLAAPEIERAYERFRQAHGLPAPARQCSPG